MKKSSKIMFALAAIVHVANMQSTSLIEHFEEIKTEAIKDAQDGLTSLEDNYDEIIDHLEKAISYTKTLKEAHKSIHQHAQASEAIKDHVAKGASSKSREAIKTYDKTADKADDKAESHLKEAHHLSEKLNRHQQKALQHAKTAHAETVKSHDEAQQAVARDTKHAAKKANHDMKHDHGQSKSDKHS